MMRSVCGQPAQRTENTYESTEKAGETSSLDISGSVEALAGLLCEDNSIGTLLRLLPRL